ncbi:hypothetical protein BGZ51_008907 [Haplosporangium sp. Z 767]|nr:hypothetical protein BGZ51_008907 [Haplosporangium sp. Z 767]
MASLPAAEDGPLATINNHNSSSISNSITTDSNAHRNSSSSQECALTISIPQSQQQQPSLLNINNGNQLTQSPTTYEPSTVALNAAAHQQTRAESSQTNIESTRGQSRPLHEPQNNRLFASQTFAEGMGGSIQSLRRKAFERMNSHKDKNESILAPVPSTTATGVARPVMPRSRPSIAQFAARDQPPKMIIPPPYGQEEEQEAAIALAAGIPNDILYVNAGYPPLQRVLSDSESVVSDDEPLVRVHFEIHLQEDVDGEPICPLNEKNIATLVNELDLTEKERSEVEAIQTKEELAEYFEKIPRDYDVRIIVSDDAPESPGVTFAHNDLALNGDSIAVIRRESISPVEAKKSRRKKQKYRRPTTDLSTMPVQEPKASWLELFYDLLFVANLTEFTHNHPITGSTALAHYIGWFIIMWWAWAGQTFWAARYDMDDLFTKLFKLIEFCTLISFGAFSSDHLDRTSTGFIASYIMLKAILVIEYGNAMFIWGVTILVHHIAWRYVMWYFTIFIEVVVLMSFGRRTSVTFAGSHLPERFALFTIIVLGENVIGLIGLSAGASAWERGQDSFLVLFLLTTVILYALWWLYFDDFSEDVFHKTTTLSQLWAYLHLPLHVCIVLVGTGALDLIRLYKLEHHISDIVTSTENAHLVAMSLPSLGLTNKHVALGFEVPLGRRIAASGGGSFMERDTDYDLTKQYFLVVCGLVFLCNSLLKWINLRSYDRFQRIVYLSRFLNAIFILCLLAVPLDKMTPIALLGSMAFFCVLQVAVDLAVIYFGAYGFVDDLEAWARSARSSIDLGSILPTPLGGRSRTNSRAGSMVNLHSLAFGPKGLKSLNGNTSTTSLVNPHGLPSPHISQKNASPYSTQQQQHHQFQQHISLQRQSPTSIQQQQQALYNMHVNANSLGSSGAYGNLVQVLAEIKRREPMNHASVDGSTFRRHMSLNTAERSHSMALAPRGPGGGGHHAHQSSNSLIRHGLRMSAEANAPAPFHRNRSFISSNSATMLASGINSPAISGGQTGGGPETSSGSTSSYFSPSSLTSASIAHPTSGGGAMGLATMFNQPRSPTP